MNYYKIGVKGMNRTHISITALFSIKLKSKNR